MENSKHVYFIDFEKHGIRSNGTAARETTDGFISALNDAVASGYKTVYVPKGNYLIDGVGEDKMPEYGGGIQFPSNIEVIFHKEAVFKVEPNSSTGYACFNLENVDNVILRGGCVVGERFEHDYDMNVSPFRRTHEWGYGVHIRGCRNILIEDMHISDCTGDCIWVPAHGMMNWGDTVYIPSESITIRKCRTEKGRRNNIATDGCLGLLIDDCDIIKAGGDTIGPQLGIDLEGYAEDGIKYGHPYEINITNCRFRKNGRGALNINVSAKVHATNNFSDDVFSYGYSSDVSICNNKIINDSGTVKKYGIDSIRKSSTETGNRAIISGNHVIGFEIGICARGLGVKISNNYLKDISSIGIYPYLAEEVSVSDNIIDSNCLHVWVRESKDVKISDNKTKGAANYFAYRVEASSDVIISDSKSQSKGGIQVLRSRKVVLKDNDLALIGTDYGIHWDKQSEVEVLHNTVRDAAMIAIAGNSELYPSIIKGNNIKDCTYLVGLYVNGGSDHILWDNDVSFKGTGSANGGYGVQLVGTENAWLMNNKVRVSNGRTLSSSYESRGSQNTMYINNALQTGKLNSHESDYVNGIIELPFSTQ
ncbi:tail spike protein [Bacillus phage Bobb]|uniref:Tailspike protein n=1 Tax=Bacillus phage Bobb TaxID=1527469 RepID=A0A076G7N8_9CAUD|nr:tail spike protein [Bacillus phage Bobb]AII28141.1 tailspike protein [Bacillus phage Bobb]